ncbi:MAG: BBP7 family outer membrane beta-barrel protein [Candidatus Nealsonbacteria bacterium]|nr:BBP7 family outer membrane beta-barrel protein [Candidatus Nealsonbacteria bacterium]
MKHAAWTILAALAWIGVIPGADAVAQELVPTPVPLLGSGESQPEADETPITAEVIDGSSWLDDGIFSELEDGPCCAVCGEGKGCPANWYFDQGIRVLTRGRPRGRLVTSELSSNGAVLIPLIGIRMLSYDVAAGYHATIGRYLGCDTENRDHFAEFTYWGMNDWRESLSRNGGRFTYSHTIDDPDNPGTPIQVPFFQGGALFVPFAASVGGFNRADSHSLYATSSINNFELNVRLVPRVTADRSVLHRGRWRHECQPGWSFSYLFGLRVTSIDDSFALRSTGSVFDVDVDGNQTSPAVDISGDYFSKTHNDMFGMQFGIELMHRKCKWQWGFRSKLAPFINFADETSIVTTDATADPFVATDMNVFHTARADSAAVIAEIGATARYKLRPDLIVSAAYDLMWISGLALGAEQIQYTDTPVARISDNGTILYMGLTMNIEWMW